MWGGPAGEARGAGSSRRWRDVGDVAVDVSAAAPGPWPLQPGRASLPSGEFGSTAMYLGRVAADVLTTALDPVAFRVECRARVRAARSMARPRRCGCRGARWSSRRRGIAPGSSRTWVLESAAAPLCGAPPWCGCRSATAGDPVALQLGLAPLRRAPRFGVPNPMRRQSESRAWARQARCGRLGCPSCRSPSRPGRRSVASE